MSRSCSAFRGDLKTARLARLVCGLSPFFIHADLESVRHVSLFGSVGQRDETGLALMQLAHPCRGKAYAMTLKRNAMGAWWAT